MISFVLPLSGEANETDPCSLEWQEGDDDLVEVTVGQMRMAACKDKMLLTEKALVEDLRTAIADHEDRIDKLLNESKGPEMADAFLGSATSYLKMVAITAIVLLAVQTLGEIISWSR